MMKSIKLEKSCLNMIMYFPVILLFFQVFNFYFNFNIAKIYELIILFLLILLEKKMSNKISTLYIIIITLLYIILKYGYNDFNMSYKFIYALIILSFFTNNNILRNFKEILDLNLNRLNKIVYLNNFIIILFLFNKRAYFNKWGEGMYFKGPFDSPHQFGYCLLALLCVCTYNYLKTNNYKAIINIFVIICFISLTGARSVFLTSGLISLIPLFHFIKLKRRNIFIFVIISIFLVLVGGEFIINTPVVEKMIYTVTTESTNVTSGRDIIMKNNIDAYKRSSLLNKITGGGMGITNNINYNTIGNDIWAHNDLIQILLGYGIVGIFIYLLILLKLIIKNRSILLCVILFTVILVNGYFNYNYFVIAIPYLLLICNKNCQYKFIF